MSFEIATDVDYAKLAEKLDVIDFGHPFVLNPDGSITDAAQNVHAPGAYDQEDDHHYVSTILEGADTWEWVWSYAGPVLHPSEHIGLRIAEALHQMTEDGPQTFAVVVVTDLDSEDDSGWGIVRLK